MKKYIIVFVILVIAIIGIYFAISNNKNSQNINQTTTPTTEVSNTFPDKPTNITVDIKNLAFTPQVLKIKIGTTVTWFNSDPMSHTVTSDSDNILNSPTLSSGESFSFTFSKVGTTDYHCNIHKTMKGKIIVE